MTATDVVQRTPAQTLQAQVRSPQFLDQVRMALPGNVRPERFQRAVITAIMQNPEVVVDPDSFFRSAIQAAQDGLIPDGREAAFVVVKERGIKKVAYWPMVGGYRKIAAKHGIRLVSDVVRARDGFEWQKVPPMLKHAPAAGDRGEIIYTYAAAFDQDWQFVAAPVVMDVDEIEKVRKVSRAAESEYGPWVNWWDRMACKTVTRRLFNELPLGDLEEIDANILRAADNEADLDTGGLSLEEANIAAGLTNVGPPHDSGPDDAAAASPPPEAAAAEPEDGEWQDADEPIEGAEFVDAPFASFGDVVIPGGVHKGKTLADLKQSMDGQQWLLTQLRRLAADDPMREPIEAFVQAELPLIWERYQS